MQGSDSETLHQHFRRACLVPVIDMKSCMFVYNSTNSAAVTIHNGASGEKAGVILGPSNRKDCTGQHWDALAPAAGRPPWWPCSEPPLPHSPGGSSSLPPPAPWLCVCPCKPPHRYLQHIHKSSHPPALANQRVMNYFYGQSKPKSASETRLTFTNFLDLQVVIHHFLWGRMQVSIYDFHS